MRTNIVERNIVYTQKRIKRAQRWLNSPRIRTEAGRARWQRELDHELEMLAKYVAEKLKQ